MGKTNPTYRDLLDDWIHSYDHYRRGLRHPWDEDFERMMDGAKQHADAASYANPIQPEIPEVALLSICLEQQRQINSLEAKMKDVKKLTGDTARVVFSNDDDTDG